MIIQYFTVDGRCKIEKSRVNARYIEMPDGDHPITNDSVWQDDKRTRQPILCVFEGVTPPMGADMSENDIETLLTEIELIKLGFKKPSISKMWLRSLGHIVDFFTSKALRIGIIVMVLYFVVQALLGSM